jgi:hypothetical protein
MTRHSSCQRTCPRSFGPRNASGSAEVAMHHPFLPLYDGPYTVLQRSLHHFRLQLADREDNVSTSWLKPCTGGAAISGGTATRPAPVGTTHRPCPT